MYLFAKFGYHRSSYKDILEKGELTASIGYIAIFLKSEIPIYNSELLDTADRKTRRRKRRGTQAIPKRYAFHAKAITVLNFCGFCQGYFCLAPGRKSSQLTVKKETSILQMFQKIFLGAFQNNFIYFSILVLSFIAKRLYCVGSAFYYCD